MSERYFITGINGQVGRALRKEYPSAKAAGHGELDISNESEVNSVDWSRYDVIINAAAYVNADNSETTEGRELAWAANAVGARNLAKAAIEHSLHLIHISSEYVFDGTKTNHREDESFTPLNVYGQSKAAGDIAVSLVEKHHILRTSWVVGDGHNFVKTMNTLANKGIDPIVVNDQYGRLTFASELVRAVDFILKKDIKYGTYNLSNSGEIKSWAGIARGVFEASGHNPDRVKQISTVEYMRGKMPFAPRPTHSDMDLTKIKETGFISHDYEHLLKEYVHDLG